MRSRAIGTNLRCNQLCTYCDRRRADDDLASIQPRKVIAAIGAALDQGAREIVLTGGEPALRGDLARLVAEARRLGAERVVIETNATLIDAAGATALDAAGLTAARVNLSGWGDALDDVTRDPGGFRRTIDGIGALLAAGVTVRLQATLVRSTRAMLPGLPARVVAHFGADVIDLLSIVVPCEGPEAAELLSYPEAATTILAVDAGARIARLPLQLAPGQNPPPCFFPPTARSAALYSLTAGARDAAGFVKLPQCQQCRVEDRCPGLPEPYLRQHPVPSLRPITDDRLRRRLSVISTVREQVEREFVQVDRFPASQQPAQETIRVVFQCNQSCHFCFVSTHLPNVEEARVREAISSAGARGSQIILSGGEPTLHPRLVSLVRLAKSSSRLPVVLQTNAVRLDNETEVRALAEAGLDEAFVSLHGATAAVSDQVTDAPETFVRTARGLDHLHASAIALTINFVVCRLNLHELPAVTSLIGDRWPRARVNISFVAPSADVVPRDTTLVPRYSELFPLLAMAAEEAVRRRMTFSGPGRTCGIPRCLVPSSPAFDESRDGELAAGPEPTHEFIKPPPCSRCVESPRCHGLRRGYVALYGSDEVRPITDSRA